MTKICSFTSLVSRHLLLAALLLHAPAPHHGGDGRGWRHVVGPGGVDARVGALPARSVLAHGPGLDWNLLTRSLCSVTNIV